jgi:hypothetical protein
MWIIKNSDGTPVRVVTDEADPLADGQTRVAATDSEVLAAQAAIARHSAIDACEAARRARYVAEADPLFFKYQRGEATEQEWKDAVARIRSALPKPE